MREAGATAIAVGHHPALAILMTGVVVSHVVVAGHPLRLLLQVRHRLVDMPPTVPVVAISMSTMGARSSVPMVGLSMVVDVSARKLHSIWRAASWSSIWTCQMRMETLITISISHIREMATPIAILEAAVVARVVQSSTSQKTMAIAFKPQPGIRTAVVAIMMERRKQEASQAKCTSKRLGTQTDHRRPSLSMETSTVAKVSKM